MSLLLLLHAPALLGAAAAALLRSRLTLSALAALLLLSCHSFHLLSIVNFVGAVLPAKKMPESAQPFRERGAIDARVRPTPADGLCQPIHDWRLAVLEGAASAAPYQPAKGNAS